MQESWKLEIPENLLKETSEKMIEELLLQEAKQVGIFLSYYFKKQGAITEHVQISEKPTFQEEHRGKVQVNFDLVYFNACLNIHETNKDQMELQFEIDLESKILILTGPYWPEREMDEI